MIIELTNIADVWKTTSNPFYDERGNFSESFKESSVFHKTGKEFGIGSETFGKSISFELQAGDGIGVLILDRLGHSFHSREDGSILSYALSTEYDPKHDRTINPLDKELNIPWPQEAHTLSLKDSNAPTIMHLSEQSQLPLFARSN